MFAYDTESDLLSLVNFIFEVKFEIGVCFDFCMLEHIKFFGSFVVKSSWIWLSIAFLKPVSRKTSSFEVSFLVSYLLLSCA